VFSVSANGQTVICWPRVQSQDNPCQICSGKMGTGIVVSDYSDFLLSVSFHQTAMRYCRIIYTFFLVIVLLYLCNSIILMSIYTCTPKTRRQVLHKQTTHLI
jgi:hypothetical protein